MTSLMIDGWVAYPSEMQEDRRERRRSACSAMPLLPEARH
jgi:hypothetical protein